MASSGYLASRSLMSTCCWYYDSTPRLALDSYPFDVFWRCERDCRTHFLTRWLEMVEGGVGVVNRLDLTTSSDYRSVNQFGPHILATVYHLDSHFRNGHFPRQAPIVRAHTLASSWRGRHRADTSGPPAPRLHHPEPMSRHPQLPAHLAWWTRNPC